MRSLLKSLITQDKIIFQEPNDKEKGREEGVQNLFLFLFILSNRYIQLLSHTNQTHTKISKFLRAHNQNNESKQLKKLHLESYKISLHT